MKIHTTNQQMEELINEARNEKPIMPLQEVESIIGAASYTPAVAVKGLHIGINSLIVISGIVVSSFLAYMALKVDSVNIPTTPATTEQITELPPATSMTAESKAVPVNNLRSTTSEKVKQQDLVRPKPTTEKLTASTNTNTVIASEEAAPAAEATSTMVSKKKIMSGQFMITFYYNDQQVEMKVAGDDIAELAVNQKVVPVSNYDDYSDVIAEGRNYLMGEHAKEVNTLQLINFFDTQLQADNILKADAHYTFELSSSQLLINKASQSFDVFSKYKKLYESKTGKVITSGSTYRYEKGN